VAGQPGKVSLYYAGATLRFLTQNSPKYLSYLPFIGPKSKDHYLKTILKTILIINTYLRPELITFFLQLPESFVKSLEEISIVLRFFAPIFVRATIKH